VQVDPIKFVLKAPGSMLLKLRCHGPLSIVAFDSNLRRYSEERGEWPAPAGRLAGPCRLILSNPI